MTIYTVAPTHADTAKFTWAEGHIAGPLQSASTTCVALSDQLLETTCAFEVGDALLAGAILREVDDVVTIQVVVVAIVVAIAHTRDIGNQLILEVIHCW